MSWFKKLRGGSADAKTETAALPAAPAPASKAEVEKIAKAAGMPEAEVGAYADGCVAKNMTVADVSAEIVGAMAAERSELSAAAQASIEANAKAAAAMKAAQEAADLKRVEAEAQIKAAEKERQELADTKVKLGDAGKGIDPADAPSATIVHANKTGAAGATVESKPVPASRSAALPPGAGGPMRIDLAKGALGCGNVHPYEKAITERVRAGETVKQASEAVATADRKQYQSFIAWQRDNL